MRILLDAHLSIALAKQLRRNGMDVDGLHGWMSGSYLEQSDDRILAAARSDGRVLVTRDCRTILSLLREWAASGRHHAGVILVSRATFRSSDVGRLLRALLNVAAESGDESWEDKVIFLNK